MFVRNALEIKGKYLMKCSFRFTIIRLVDLHTCPIRTLSAATPGLSIFRGFLKGFSENFILIFGHLFIVNNLNRLLIVIFLVVLWDPCYQSRWGFLTLLSEWFLLTRQKCVEKLTSALLWNTTEWIWFHQSI